MNKCKEGFEDPREGKAEREIKVRGTHFYKPKNANENSSYQSSKVAI